MIFSMIYSVKLLALAVEFTQDMARSSQRTFKRIQPLPLTCDQDLLGISHQHPG